MVSEASTLQPDPISKTGISIVRNLVGVASLPNTAANEAAQSPEPEMTPEILAQGFAPRVDRLIEQVGETTQIGDTTYHFTNGGPTVRVERSCDFVTDNHAYPYTEGVTAVLSSEGKLETIIGDMAVGKTAFDRSASGELSLNPRTLVFHMNEMITAIEQSVRDTQAA